MKFGSLVQQWQKRYKKRDARAELLFCSINLLLFAVLVAVAVVAKPA